jgi:hypothetical protein
VHSLSRLVGLAPYSFVTHTPNEVETIQISYSKNLKIVSWSAILLTVQFVGLLYIIVSNFTEQPHSVSGLVAKSLQFPLINATGLAALGASLTLNRNKMLNVVENLSTMDKLISHNKAAVSKKHNFKFVIIIMITVTYHVILHSINMYINRRRYINYCYGVVIYLCDLTWAVNDLQYAHIVAILTQRLISLNEEIGRILLTQSQSSSKANRSNRYGSAGDISLLNCREGFRNKNRRVLLNPRLQDGFRTDICSRTSGDAARILDFRICFKHLHRVCRLINSMYGLTLLLGFMTYTVCLTLDTYTLCCLVITQYKGYEQLSVPRVVTAALWTVTSCTRVFCGVFVSSRAHEEFRKTVSAVRKLTLLAGLNPQVQDQLELFSIQLSSSKIEFTACGFFTVNLKLVRSLVYTVTTYIIVLVQVTWFN